MMDQERLNIIRKLLDELGVIQLLEQNTRLDQQYLVDRLRRALDGVEDANLLEEAALFKSERCDAPHR